MDLGTRIFAPDDDYGRREMINAFFLDMFDQEDANNLISLYRDLDEKAGSEDRQEQGNAYWNHLLTNIERMEKKLF